jgi:hypothetical protein
MDCDSCGTSVPPEADTCPWCDEYLVGEDCPEERGTETGGRRPLVTDGGKQPDDEEDPLSDPGEDAEDDDKYDYLEPEDIVGDDANGEAEDASGDKPPADDPDDPPGHSGQEDQPRREGDQPPDDQQGGQQPDDQRGGQPSREQQGGRPPEEQRGGGREADRGTGQPRDEGTPNGQGGQPPNGQGGQPPNGQGGQPPNGQGGQSQAGQGDQPLDDRAAGTGGSGAPTGEAGAPLGGNQQAGQPSQQTGQQPAQQTGQQPTQETAEQTTGAGGLIEELKRYPLKLGTALGVVAFLVPYILLSLATFFGYEKPPGENYEEIIVSQLVPGAERTARLSAA